MKRIPVTRVLARIPALWCFLFCALMVSLSASTANAKPITYTGFTITDGKLGSWEFHNARVYLTLQSDTSAVKSMQVTDPTNGNAAQILINASGKATVTITTSGRTVIATFAPGQIFGSLDLGDPTTPPLVGGRGVGFGSFSSTAVGGFEPAYPLGIEDGTIDWGDSALPSQALSTLSLDLKHNTEFSGRAWVCVGFPDTTCPTPTQALNTDKGDLYLYQPYALAQSYINCCDSLSAGFFLADLGRDNEEPNSRDEEPRGTSRQASAKPISYNGYVIADVTLGELHFKGAQIYISVDSDSTTAEPFPDNPSGGFINSAGETHIKIISGRRTISADFAPDQVYVYFDKTSGSVGFGSYAGGRGYPLSLTANADREGLVENSSVGAVADIMTMSADATNYTDATASLVTDLTNPTTLSGAASSCVEFDPATSICSNLNPVPLKTDKGDFYIFEPYTDDETTTTDAQPFSINWGVFWSERPRMHE
jgi:hypothetical protein